MAHQCSCCRTLVVTTLCCCRVQICENGKTEIRAVIKYLVKKLKKAKEIHADFQNTLGDSAPSYLLLPSVLYWLDGVAIAAQTVEIDPLGHVRVVEALQNFVQKCNSMILPEVHIHIAGVQQFHCH
jgi:hypothetical protein